jgi:autotransporter strand-loop-strand O-heptosyltransferase
MKIINVTPGIIPIPPNGWGATEKIIWEIHNNLLLLGHDSGIEYLDTVPVNADVVHIHMANLAILAHQRGIPYYFTCHDHHAYLYGKESSVYKENLEAMRHAIKAFVPAKYLVEYFDNIPQYFSHGVNPLFFHPPSNRKQHKLLCVANNGYVHNPSEDRKGFGIAIAAAEQLGLPITIAGPSNNKNYFSTNPPSYNKLTILYDLDESELLTLYREHSIFVHASQLEAGHPNLTLLEALSCGLPVVGTLEKNNTLKGMVVTNPIVDEVTKGILEVIEYYTEYTTNARQQAELLSWNNRTKELLSIYSQATTMKHKLLQHYNNTIQLKKKLSAKMNFNNIDGMFAEILGGEDTSYGVRFINTDTNAIEYETKLSKNCWARASTKYFVNWKVEIENNKTGEVHTHELNLKDKRVYISLESKSLGDTIAWFPYVEEFRKKHDCQMVCSTFWNKFFEGTYPDIEFVDPGETVDNLAAMYNVGLFYDGDGKLDKFRHRNNPLARPLQAIAADILGLEYKEVKPRIVSPIVPKIESKQVTIAIHSTAQAKYWNNPTGWQEVVDWLISRGYTVKLLSSEGTDYMRNKAPTGVVLHPNSSIEDVMVELKKSKMFIGVSSGLSWLSWALGIPTVVISGFTDAMNEMTDCIRITAPEGKCSGCWHRHKFNPSDWNWCPDHEGTTRQFECTKDISADTVINALSIFLQPKPRIQIKHLLTQPTDTREVLSTQSITKLKQYGMDYQPIVNEVYDDIPPAENCRRPHHINTEPASLHNGVGYLTGRHYGCYLAHRNAIASMDDANYDYTLIFEADAHIASDELEEFVNTVYKACMISEKNDVYYISFARNNSNFERVDDTFLKTEHYQDLTHCYIIANRHKNWWLSRIQDCEWDVSDLWFNHVFYHYPQLRYTTQKMLCRQLEGMSLIDKIIKHG